jgi:hypothetical protein
MPDYQIVDRQAIIVVTGIMAAGKSRLRGCSLNVLRMA